MKSIIRNSGIFFFLLHHSFLFSQNDQETKINLFEPGVISTEAVEFAPSFSSSGTEMYFARSMGKWGTGNMKSAIYVSFLENGKWSPPSLASFSGQFDDSDPHISRDGNTLYFISQRPSEGNKSSADIWRVERYKDGPWGVPQRLANPLNSDYREYSPRTDKHGNLYFASDRPGGHGQGDLYMVLQERGIFSAPINLGPTLNSDTGEWNLEINKKGTLLIFEASQREQNVSSYGDLYISYRKGNKWSIPQHMEELNTSGSDLYPHFTDKESTLFYTSSDSLTSTNTNIYVIDFSPLNKKYRKKAVFVK